MISVIVPVYKVEQYLRECLDSILEQTYRDFELILVDDGSPDDSPRICEEYAIKDSRVVVIHKSNGGLSDARNAGMKVAQGEYVTFIDSDDYIAKDYLAYLYTILKREQADISACSLCKVIDGIVYNECMCEHLIKYTPYTAIQSLLIEKDGISTSACGKLFKKTLFENDICFPEGKLFEDLFTIYKLFDLSNVIIYSLSTKYYYRSTPNSIMNSPFSVKTLDILVAHDELERFVNDKYPILQTDVCNRKVRYCVSYLYRILLSDYRNKEVEYLLQQVIRDGIVNYLKSSYKIKSRLIALLMCFDLRLVRCVLWSIR